MGIAFVLILYIVVGGALAVGASVSLGAGSRFLLRRAPAKRKRAVFVSAAFPLACAAFAAAWFIVYASVNMVALHRDPGIGDSWSTPLPNGYALLMIDVTDEGTVYNPATQPNSSSVGTRDDAVFGVQQLQVDHSLIYGAQDTKYFEHLALESGAVDRYFELDTKNHTHAEFDSLDALRSRASSRGVALQLRPFYEIYSEYRFTAFDYTAFALLVLIPLTTFLVLVRWIWRLRGAGLSASVEPVFD